MSTIHKPRETQHSEYASLWPISFPWIRTKVPLLFADGLGQVMLTIDRRSTMSEMNFSLIKLAHRTWRMKLRAFLDGREKIDPKQIASHQDCELGKWLYSTGLSKYSHLNDLKELEKKHKVMHAIVKQVVDLKMAGKDKEAEQEFVKVHDAAEGVVSLVTAVETKMK
jgi:hypothetical protein